MNNDGKESLEDVSTYSSLFDVIDAEKMEVALQVTVDGKQTGFSIKVFESDKTLKRR